MARRKKHRTGKRRRRLSAKARAACIRNLKKAHAKRRKRRHRK